MIRPRLLPRPPIKEAAAPLPVLRVFRILTTSRPTARAIPHQLRVNTSVQATSAQATLTQTTPPHFVPLPARVPALSTGVPAVVPADAARPPVRRETSRGATGEGAGWAGGAGNYTNMKASGPFGIGDGLAASGVVRHIVYVLDTSGSMRSRLSRAEDELTEALRGLHPGETFNIVAFSGGSQVFDPDMAEAAPGSIQRASAFLNDLEANGDTDLEDAIVRALLLRDVNEVVVLTDGIPTVGEKDPKKLAQTLQRFNLRHARISTIGLVGRNADSTADGFEAAQLLQQIARDSGGTSKLVTVGIASP